jgi:hypothetical protein
MNPALRMYWLKISDKSIITKSLAKIYLHHSGESRNSVFSLSFIPRLLQEWQKLIISQKSQRYKMARSSVDVLHGLNELMTNLIEREKDIWLK